MGDMVMLDWWWMMDWWVTLLMMIWREMTDTGMSDIYIGPYFRKVFMYLRKVFRDVTGVRDVLAHSARCRAASTVSLGQRLMSWTNSMSRKE